jgi:hypothetical protein
VHTSRDIIFNETELTRNISVKGLPQSITAPTNIITTNILTENKKDKSIAARTRKAIFKTELPKEVVKITKISAKLINMIVSRRNPNIVYKNLIEKDPTLPKIIIAKIIPNEDKPSYEIAMANLKISQ